MLSDKEKELILSELSGQNAQAMIAEISKYDRLDGTQEHHLALEYVRKKFVEAGVKDIKIHKYPIRPGQRYWAWANEYIWEPQDAELRIVQPGEEARILARFPEDTISLSGRSCSTPPQGIKAEVVDVGFGDQTSCYKNKDLHGKIALISGGPYGSCLAPYLAAVHYGAVGVITCPNEARFLDFPDMAVMDRVFTQPRYRKKYFGFSVSKRQFEYLRNLIHTEHSTGRKVILFARVKTLFRRGMTEVLDCCIKGSHSGRGEVIFVAHLSHRRPSANDNASGCALAVEIARTLVKLIKEKRLASPKHSLRFLILTEWTGTIPWIYQHQKHIKNNVCAAISLDMVGEDQVKCNSVLGVTSTPPTLPSYLPDLMGAELEWVSGRASIGHHVARTGTVAGKLRKATPFRWAHRGYSGWSDNMPFVFEPISVPAISLTAAPDNFYHSSLDTVDKTDPNVLEKTGLAALATALNITNADFYDALRIAHLTASEAKKRIINLIQEITSGSDTPDLAQAHERLAYLLSIEQKRIASVMDLVAASSATRLRQEVVHRYQQSMGEFLRLVRAELGDLKESLPKPRTRLLKLSPLEKKTMKLIPQKLFTGPFESPCYIYKLTEKSLYDYLTLLGNRLFRRIEDLAILYVDGKRSIYDIYKFITYERPEIDPPGGQTGLKLLLDYFDFLCRMSRMKLSLTSR